MATKNQKKKPATDRVPVSDLLDKAIAKFETRVLEDGFSPSVGDYLKLMQMKKELDEAEEDAKEIRVTWIEPEDSENST